MKKFVVSAGLVAAACSANAVVLYNNGPIVDSNGLSILQTTTPASTTLGVASLSTQTVADNFSVGGLGWNVQTLDFYAYQTSAVGFTFTNVTWSLRAGTDPNTATTLSSGTTAVTNAGLVGYRVTATTTTNTTRAIYRINADIPDITLPVGSYFVTFALAGTSASGPFVPPVLASLGSGNAYFQTTAAFNPVTDGGSLLTMDLPFTVNGVAVVPEPSTWAMMIVGVLGLAGVARRRAGV